MEAKMKDLRWALQLTAGQLGLLRLLADVS